ncbi:cobalt-precorrin-7 (C(5))-methyltransferase [Archaeoglobus neptunius]|uniref:cobalt-precorrin-7 (C(5))-methyltransferase n=1 Tax=Archaeoglobus neptunius TaxID=2798580 RepID=UPI0019253E04|nr:cobalt-precorrin-7 (C(5))-methyltransferase [Archaeoglobus neptunius]
MIWIIGSGICKKQVTERAAELIRQADIICGSKRAIDIVGVKDDRVRILRKFSMQEFERLLEEAAGRKVVIISTGDPMVAGLGRMLRDYDVIIEPGISSVQVALSRLKVDLTEVAVVDCHAREFDEELFELVRYRHLLILADRGFAISKLGRRRVVILENLCMGGERVWEGMAVDGEIMSDHAIVFVEKEVVG